MSDPITLANEKKSKGTLEYQEGNFHEAIKLFSEAIELNGQDHKLYSNRSIVFAALGYWERSLFDAERSCALSPNWSKGVFRKGLALLQLGKYQEAIAELKRAQELEPKNQEISKKILEAEKREKAYSIWLPFKDEGNQFYKDSKYEQAIQSYSKALTSCPEEEFERSTIYGNRAMCYMQLQSYPEVIKDANSALAINPLNVKALLRRGLALEAMEKYTPALADMRKALSLEPTLTMASQAVPRLEKAIKTMDSWK